MLPARLYLDGNAMDAGDLAKSLDVRTNAFRKCHFSRPPVFDLTVVRQIVL
jgi:hypothetical protein